MEISVKSPELIDALCRRIGELTAELETTKIALGKAQEAVKFLEDKANDQSQMFLF